MSTKQKFTHSGLVFTVKHVENGDGCGDCPFFLDSAMCGAAPDCGTISHFKIVRVRVAKEAKVHDEDSR